MPFYRFGSIGQSGWVHLNLGRRAGAAMCVGPRLEADNAIPNDGGRCCRASVALCDHRVSNDLAGNQRTCSAPMCEHHRQRVGVNEDRCTRHRIEERLAL